MEQGASSHTGTSHQQPAYTFLSLLGSRSIVSSRLVKCQQTHYANSHGFRICQNVHQQASKVMSMPWSNLASAYPQRQFTHDYLNTRPLYGFLSNSKQYFPKVTGAKIQETLIRKSHQSGCDTMVTQPRLFTYDQKGEDYQGDHEENRSPCLLQDTEAEYRSSNQEKQVASASAPQTSSVPAGWEKFKEFNCKTYTAPIRKPNLLWPNDRVRVFEQNRQRLQTLVVVDNGLLVKLQSQGVITQLEAEDIQSDTNPVHRLLTFLEKKCNDDYEQFCEALYYTGQQGIVYNLLLTPGDLDDARDKLLSFLETQYRDIQLYTASREPHPVPLSKLYVNLEWDLERDTESVTDQQHDTGSNTEHKQGTNSNRNRTPDLEEYLRQVEISSNTRFVIKGEPGAGKTTCVKRICQIWSSNNRQINKNSDLLSGFILVIPVVLRLIQFKSPLFDILLSQLTTLTALHIHAILKCMEVFPSRVLLLLDGYDELRHKEIIDSILQCSDYPDVKVIVTTRPHGITLLKNLGSLAVQRKAQILGFNEEQRYEYIIMYYSMRHDKAKGQRLIEYLQHRKPALLSLARIPIRLEMMCIVWDAKEDLGELLVDLYVRFIQHLLDRMEQKDDKCRTPEHDILVTYHHLLMQIACLANRFDRFGRMNAILTYSDLNALGESVNNAIDLGCLVKYSPTSNLELADWQFTHLSLQEFFLAYYLSRNKSRKDIVSYIKKCDTIEKVDKQQNVLSFLCGFNSGQANQVITSIVKQITDEEGSKRLFAVLRHLVSSFRTKTDVDIPLPKIVELTDEHESDECLFKNDRKYQNLQSLTVKKITHPVCRRNLQYIKSLIIKHHTRIDISEDEIKSVAKTMKNVISVTVDSQYKNYNALFEELPKVKVKHITLHNLVALGQPECLSQFTKLESLQIIDPDINSINGICNSVTNIKSMDFVSLDSEGLPHALLNLESQVKLSLRVRKLKRENLEDFIELLTQKTTKPKIRKLDFSGINLRLLGTELGQLMVSLPDVETLYLARCNITAETMKNITDVINKEAKKLKMKILVLRDNDLASAGEYLAVLLQHTKLLQSLALTATNMTDDDVNKITSRNIPCNIRNLYMSIGNIQNNQLADIFDISTSYSELALLDYHPWTDLVECMQKPCVSHLSLLHLWRFNFSAGGALAQLVDNLPSSLQDLSIVLCRLSDREDLLYLIEKLPQALTHLNISGNQFGSAVLEIVQMKHRLCCLRDLNIGYPADADNDDLLDALREELKQDLPDLVIYCDMDQTTMVVTLGAPG